MSARPESPAASTNQQPEPKWDGKTKWPRRCNPAADDAPPKKKGRYVTVRRTETVVWRKFVPEQNESVQHTEEASDYEDDDDFTVMMKKSVTFCIK